MAKIGEKRDYVDLIIFFSLLATVLLLKYPVMNLPYYWDSLQTIQASIWMSQHNFDFNLPGHLDIGHPPLVYEILAVTYSIFGESPFVTHLIIVIFSFICVYYTYLLGSYLGGKIVGLIGAILLFYSPMYFSISGLALVDIPLTAMGVVALYYGITGRTYYYLISAIMLVLIKTPGIMIVVSILVYVAVKHIKNPRIIKRLFIYSLPAVVWGGWLAYHYIQVGWIVPKWGVSLLTNENMVHYQLHQIIRQLFSDNFRPITTFIIISALILRARPRILRTEGIVGLRLLPLFLAVLFSVVGFSFVGGYLPRYILIAYPPYFILSAVSLKSILRETRFIIPTTIILMLLFYSQWTGERTNWCGCDLETNMEYVDAIKTSKHAADYISENFPDATILTLWPQIFVMNTPEAHYVEKPFKIKNAFNYKSKLEGIDLMLYSPQSSDRHHLLRVINENKERIMLLQRFELNGKYTEVYRVNKASQEPPDGL